MNVAERIANIRATVSTALNPFDPGNALHALHDLALSDVPWLLEQLEQKEKVS